MKLFFLALMALLFQTATAQKLTYAEVLDEDNADINFEIIGRQGGMNVIYKNSKSKHYLTYYNTKMDVVKQVPLEMLNSKTRSVDFISYPDKLMMFYQFKDDNSFVCEAISISNDGVVSQNPIQLDAVKSGSVSFRVFNISHSEDKSKILVYKMLVAGDTLTWTNRIFDSALNFQDFGTHKIKFHKDRDVFTDAVISNEGVVAIGFMNSQHNKYKASKITLLHKTMDTLSWTITDASKEGVFLDEMMLKVDNINKRFVFVSMYAKTARGYYAGLYNTVVPFFQNGVVSTTYEFPEALKKKFNSGSSDRKAFEHVTVNQVVIKRDGGLLITAEENQTNTNRRRFNGYNSMYDYGAYDHYYGYQNYSPYMNRPYFRRYPGYYPLDRTEYEHKSSNILLVSLDSQLQPDWNTLIEKDQREMNTNQSISHGVMNSGGMFHFLYTLRNRNMISIGHSSIKPNGEYNSFPSITFRQRNAEIMPRYSKQVGYADVIIPYQISDKVGFVLVEF